MEQEGTGLGAFQLVMLALGMVVGGSFFLGSAIAIREAGPAIVLAFAFGGVLVFIILSALSEMTVADPSPGSFRVYAHKALGGYAGYVVGWMYWLALVLAMSSEAIAASVFLKRWLPFIGAPTLAALVIVMVTGGNLLGARVFSRLEGGLAAVKVGAVVAFIVAALALISGLFPGVPAVGAGVLSSEPLAPRGVSGIAGSMLIVMFTYAGFEVIGLASSDARNPGKTVPRAIRYTVAALAGLYLAALLVLLPLVRTGVLNESTAPIAAALLAHGLTGLASITNIVLVSAILSTILAALFGLGRMLRSLALEEQAPRWLQAQDSRGVPRRAIFASGTAMLAGLGLGYILPDRVYLFLVSSSGFALLFSYLVILVAHYKLRRAEGCLDRNRLAHNHHCQHASHQGPGRRPGGRPVTRRSREPGLRHGKGPRTGYCKKGITGAAHHAGSTSTVETA